MKQNIKIAILGGGDRTGKFLVTQLIDQGYKIKLLLRQGSINGPLGFTKLHGFINLNSLSNIRGVIKATLF
jgi:hypothetical protein